MANPAEPRATLTEHPGRDRYTVTVDFAATDLHEMAGRYGRVVLDRICDAVVADLLASAAIQTRLARLRAELPTRIEDALTRAITQAVLASAPPPAADPATDPNP